jgi:Flp pilus assembly pilin Flp
MFRDSEYDNIAYFIIAVFLIGFLSVVGFGLWGLWSFIKFIL